LFATYDVGDALATALAGEPVTLHMKVDTVWEARTSKNVLAETTAGNDGEVVILGAHLDSAPEGPGISDNGTGVAALIEIARAVAPCSPTRKIRFAFWTAEEMGLFGSATYMFGPLAPDPATVHMYLNADMIGSPNPVHFIYDGDGSTFGVPGREGSAAIERFFEADFSDHGMPFAPVLLLDRSDAGVFHLAGVAHGGLFTGAEGIKTPEQAAVFGGTANAPYDPCYHSSCDTRDNVDLPTLEVMAQSLARATQYFGVEGNTQPPSP
jgi:Zn-dependent M28 family amino/carboxypeptidase